MSYTSQAIKILDELIASCQSQIANSAGDPVKLRKEIAAYEKEKKELQK